MASTALDGPEHLPTIPMPSPEGTAGGTVAPVRIDRQRRLRPARRPTRSQDSIWSRTRRRPSIFGDYVAHARPVDRSRSRRLGTTGPDQDQRRRHEGLPGTRTCLYGLSLRTLAGLRTSTLRPGPAAGRQRRHPVERLEQWKHEQHGLRAVTQSGDHAAQHRGGQFVKTANFHVAYWRGPSPSCSPDAQRRAVWPTAILRWATPTAARCRPN